MGRAVATLVLALNLFGCASTAPRSGVLAPSCGTTPISVHDVERFGFHPAPGKVTVMRVFATWCPYCKSDLDHIAVHFKDGTWPSADVQLFLLAYQNHSEDAASFAEFKAKAAKEFGLPASAVQMIYIDKPYADLAKLRTPSGHELFIGWQGVPFALVFGRDGRLAYRGHFTTSDQYQSAHYQFVQELIAQRCPPASPAL